MSKRIIYIQDGDPERVSGASHLDHLHANDLLYANYGIARVMEFIAEQGDHDDTVALASAARVVAAVLMDRMAFMDVPDDAKPDVVGGGS